MTWFLRAIGIGAGFVLGITLTGFFMLWILWSIAAALLPGLIAVVAPWIFVLAFLRLIWK